MSANKLIFETGVDGTGFSRGLNSLTEEATHSLKSLVVGAFGLYGIHQIFEKTIEKAEELVNTSKRLGEVPEQLQVMQQAAKEGGVEFDKLAAAYDRVNIAREKALAGDARAKAAFARFGIGTDALKSQSAGELLRGPFRDAIHSQNPQDLNKPGADIFGARSFGQLIPVLSSDFEELQHKMESLGSIMSTETAVAIKTTKDEFDLLSNIIIAQLAPAMVALAEFFLRLSAPLAYWINLFGSAAENRGGYFNAATDAGMAQMLEGRRKRQGDDSLSPAEKEWLEKFNSDAIKITTQAKSAGDESQAGIDKLIARIHDMADKLSNPPPPIPGDHPGLLKAAPRGSRRPEFSADALLQVGNFLGGGASLVNSIAMEHLDVAKQTLAETKLQTDAIKLQTDAIDSLGQSIEDGMDVP